MLDRTANATYCDSMGRADDLSHLNAQTNVDAGGHGLNQASVPSGRQIAEELSAVLVLIPHPAQRLAFRQIRGLALDPGAQPLARSPCRSRCQTGACEAMQGWPCVDPFHPSR